MQHQLHVVTQTKWVNLNTNQQFFKLKEIGTCTDKQINKMHMNFFNEH